MDEVLGCFCPGVGDGCFPPPLLAPSLQAGQPHEPGHPSTAAHHLAVGQLLVDSRGSSATGGGRPPKPSMNIYSCSRKPVLRRLIEPCQYTSRDFAEMARSNGVVLSIGRKGECWDNAVANPSSPQSNASSSTPGRGRSEPDSTVPSSTTSRVGTTPAGCTRPSAVSVPISTEHDSTSPTLRQHDQLKKHVRETGSSPVPTGRGRRISGFLTS